MYASNGSLVERALDLIGKLGSRALTPEEQKVNDAVLALIALGFKQIEAHDTVRAALNALGSQATVEDLVRASLKKGA